MLVYEQLRFDNVEWKDSPRDFGKILAIKIPIEEAADISQDLDLIGLQLIFEHKGLDDE